MEPVRPRVDDHVLELLQVRRFTANAFTETPQGACRLLPHLTIELADHLLHYKREVAIHAEAAAKVLAQASSGVVQWRTPLSRQRTLDAQVIGARGARRRRDASGADASNEPRPTCRNCGVALYGAARKLCPTCWPVARAEYMRQLGRARAKAVGASKPTTEELSGGWSFEAYQTRILPALTVLLLGEIERATGLSNATCSRVRRGLQVPNPRHWAALARLGQVDS